jgi:hypothetical protein
MVRAFSLQVVMRNLTQFGVDERHQVIECLLVPATPAHQ